MSTVKRSVLVKSSIVDKLKTAPKPKKKVVIVDDLNKEEEVDNKKEENKEIMNIPINRMIGKKLDIPWIEKYRPRILDDIVLDKVTANKISRIIADKDMPNIIITGVPGIGKTTTILCIAKALLGRNYREGVLELNASDDRGIKTVQDSIIYFCKKKLDLGDAYAKHKIIMLDEVDNMTKKAQQLINNLMEQYHKTTRFAFTCNSSSEIIEAIQSRCIILRYARLTSEQTISRLKYICEKEKVDYNESGLKALVNTSQGDMRKAINNLQLTFNGYGKVTTEAVYKLCDKPHPLTIKDIFTACHNKDIKNALKSFLILREKGYSNSDISLSMINLLKSSNVDEFTEETKIKYLNEICKTSLVISKGIDSSLQITGVLAKLCET